MALTIALLNLITSPRGKCTRDAATAHDPPTHQPKGRIRSTHGPSLITSPGL